MVDDGLDQATSRTIIAAETALARRDRDWPGGLAALLDPAFVEVGASGRAWTRAEVSTLIASAPPSVVELHDVVIERLADDVALVRFRTVDAGSADLSARRASIWVHREGTWRLQYHQGTIEANGAS